MIPFTKAHGNGNDFVMFEAERCPEVIRDRAFIQRVCDRHAGVGADGVHILSAPTEKGIDFHLDYFNSDGSWETFCANGSRCAVSLYARQKGTTGKISFVAGDGRHEAELLPDGQIRLQSVTPNFVTEMLDIDGFRGRHIDSGAPHFAIEVDDLDEELVAREGPRIRHHETFQPRGVNVNFYRRIDAHTIEVISYEKGVETVMRSCASGSTAAGFLAAMTGDLRSPVRIINPGGELVMAFDAEWQNVWVTGPAVLVFDAQLPDDF